MDFASEIVRTSSLKEEKKQSCGQKIARFSEDQRKSDETESFVPGKCKPDAKRGNGPERCGAIKSQVRYFV